MGTPAVQTQMFDRFAPGTMLGRYELLATIGEGGMARVILARQRGPAGFEKVVVIKVIHPRMAEDESMVAMLLDEARVAAQINHHNVVQVFELGEVDGTFYIVMEYLAGESLHKLVKVAAQGVAFDPRMAARIVADAADGLHAAHELQDFHGRNIGVVHRDVSLGNIIVLYSGAVKVVDFGIAKRQDRPTSTTQHGQLKGKYAYMSPEQIRNEPMDRRSDVFSLGVVLWECLAQRRLFHADSVAATLMQIVSPDRVPPSLFRPELPRELDEVALKALALDPRDRFATAADMKRALEEATWQSRCTTSDVQAFMAAVFADRIEQRRTLLAVAARDSFAVRDYEKLGIALDEASGLGTPPPSFVRARKARSRSRIVGVAVVAAGMMVGLGLGIALIASPSKPEPAQTAPAPVAPGTAPVAVPAAGGDTGGPPPAVTAIAAEQPRPIAAFDQPVVESALRPEHGAADRLEAWRRAERERAEDGAGSGSDDERPPVATPSAKELYKRGTELYLAGKFGEAEQAFRRALAADRGFAPAHRGLGFVYQRTGDTARAIAELRRYLALDRDAADADSIRNRIEQLGGQP